MAELLHTQKEVLKLLKKKGVATFNKSSFSEAVKRGQIPYRTEKGVHNKLYFYPDVAKAIKSAGIGGLKGVSNPKVEDITDPPSIQDKLNDIPDPRQGQSQEEYQEIVATQLGADATITDANIFKVIYQGKLEKIKYEKELGLLIPRDEVEDKAFSVSRAIRDKILSIPERMSSELASIDDPHVIKELLYKEFGMMLDGFSEDSFL